MCGMPFKRSSKSVTVKPRHAYEMDFLDYMQFFCLEIENNDPDKTRIIKEVGFLDKFKNPVFTTQVFFTNDNSENTNSLVPKSSKALYVYNDFPQRSKVAYAFVNFIDGDRFYGRSKDLNSLQE